MTSTTRALLSVIVVAGAAGLTARAVVGEVGDVVPPPTRRHVPTSPSAVVSRSSARTLEARPSELASFVAPAAPSTTASTEVVAGATASSTEFEPPRSVVVDGRVVDTAGAPIAGATIDCVWDRSEEVRHPVTSCVDGTFRMVVTPPASLRASAPGFVDDYEHVTSLTAAASGGPREARFVLPRAATVRGVVTYQQRPVAGARVRLTVRGKCTRFYHRVTATDRAGGFEFTECAERRYGLSAVVEVDGVPRWCSPTRRVVLGEGTTVSSALALLEVHDQVVVNLRTADGRSLVPTQRPWVSVVVGQEPLIVDDEGETTWAPVDAPFDVVARHAAMVGRTRAAPAQRDVDVTLEDEPEPAPAPVVPRQTSDEHRASGPPARVRGRVVDPRGRAVRLFLRLGDEYHATDESGRISFDLVPPGQHTLSATGDFDLIAARFHAKRATLRERVVDVAQAEELDLGDLVVEVE